MKFVAEYRQFAKDYRKLSDKLARPRDKHALELMARAWEHIATKREDRLNSVGPREPMGLRSNEGNTEQQKHYRGSDRNLFHSVSAMDQRIFIARLNIEHYRRKLLTEQHEATRQRITGLLAEEETKLAALSNQPRGNKEKDIC